MSITEMSTPVSTPTGSIEEYEKPFVPLNPAERIGESALSMAKSALTSGLKLALKTIEEPVSDNVIDKEKSKLAQVGEKASELLDIATTAVLQKANTFLENSGAESAVDAEADKATKKLTSIFNRITEILADPELQQAAVNAGKEVGDYTTILVDAMREPLSELAVVVAEADLKATGAILAGIIKVVTDAMAAVPGLGAVIEFGKISNDIAGAAGDVVHSGTTATTAASRFVYQITQNIMKQAQLLKNKQATVVSPQATVVSPEENLAGGSKKAKNRTRRRENIEHDLVSFKKAQRERIAIERRTMKRIAEFENPKLQTKRNKTGPKKRATRRRRRST
jgi:hypothetical protein